MQINKLYTYTAASSMFPRKLFLHPHAIRKELIQPLHLQLVPTDRCDKKCPWCSCNQGARQDGGEGRGRVELSFDELCDIAQYFRALGTVGVTITGGGEPTLHPQLPEFIEECRRLDIEVGLVTHGGRVVREKCDLSGVTDWITWCRLSITDTIEGKYDLDILPAFAEKMKDVDLSISFTVPENVHIPTAVAVAKFADGCPWITHVRWVNDILDPDSDAMKRVREATREWSAKGVYQDRSEFTPGVKNCLISRVKPTLHADGYVYPCCGVQYASGNPDEQRHFPPSFRMCHWRDYHKTPHFDGSGCVKCYYDHYNQALEAMTTNIDHVRFV